MLTIDERESAAYQQGDTTLASVLAQLADAHAENDTLHALVRDALDDLDSEILGDDWRERAQAAIED
jgi:hypothetical protein